MIFDDERTLRTINDAPNSHIVKIFFYLAFHQPQDGIRGFQIEKSHLAYDLKLGRTVFFEALRWLKDNVVVHELKLAQESDFMVNPFIVMNNSNRDERIAEWKRRMQLDNEKILKNRKLKRLSELRKQNQK